MHTAAKMAFRAVLCNQVEALCGKAYHPLESSDGQRAGSAPERYFFGTEEFPFQRPRVRKPKDGKSEGVRLRSYETAQSRDSLHDAWRVRRYFPMAGTSGHWIFYWIHGSVIAEWMVSAITFAPSALG